MFTRFLRREMPWWVACMLLFGTYALIEDVLLKGYTDWSIPSIAFYGGTILYAVVCVARLLAGQIGRLAALAGIVAADGAVEAQRQSQLASQRPDERDVLEFVATAADLKGWR